MVKHLDNIMNYKSEDPNHAPTNERLQQFSYFLDKDDYNKFFVWVDFDTSELRWDFYNAPKFYERGKKRPFTRFKPLNALLLINAPANELNLLNRHNLMQKLR